LEVNKIRNQSFKRTTWSEESAIVIFHGRIAIRKRMRNVT